MQRQLRWRLYGEFCRLVLRWQSWLHWKSGIHCFGLCPWEMAGHGQQALPVVLQRFHTKSWVEVHRDLVMAVEPWGFLLRRTVQWMKNDLPLLCGAADGSSQEHGDGAGDGDGDDEGDVGGLWMLAGPKTPFLGGSRQCLANKGLEHCDITRKYVSY